MNIELNKIYCGDALKVLKQIPDAIVNCCVTSPPYWGLRDYGTAKWVGGDPECDHQGEIMRRHHISDNKEKPREFYKEICGKCGAKRIDSQLGLEKTPEEYVQKLVEVFREVKRVLRKDGTVWLNLGDSYWGSGKGTGQNEDSLNLGRKTLEYGGQIKNHSLQKHNGLKPKDLVGIPWMVAFALRADGWYLRQDIIWYKKNPMPESVTDRCTKAHEYIFLLSKSAKYYYDADAIKTEMKDVSIERAKRGLSEDNKWHHGAPGSTAHTVSKPRPNVRKEWEDHMAGSGIQGHSGYFDTAGKIIGDGRANKKSVWEVPTKAFSEAHYAVYPGKLIEDCIKAGCPVGGIVLDPFIGAGTTMIVSRKQDKNCIGVELSEKNIEIANRRIHKELGIWK